MRKLALLLSALALAAFGFAACGDDDDEIEVTAVDTATEATIAEASRTGGGETVAVSADPGGELAFEQASLEAPAGPVTFEFTNDASLGHDFVIEDESGRRGRPRPR